MRQQAAEHLDRGRDGDRGRDMVFHRVDVENVRRDLLVDYATLEPDGPAGYDYTASSRTVVFRLNASSDTFVVPMLMDQVRDENEAFRVRLSNARLQTSGVGKEFADQEAVGTITDAMPIDAEFSGVPRRHEGGFSASSRA